MKNKLLFANWKSNKTKYEAKDWLVEISKYEIPSGVEVVLLPPFTLLDVICGYIRVNSMPFKIGAQDVSPFDTGAYTGEISATQIKEFADYVLIGHSERRSSLKEDSDLILKKINKSLGNELIPIVCVSNLNELSEITSKEVIIAYEPIEAIGTGNPSDTESVEKVASEIKSLGFKSVIYGGSVNSGNVKSFINLSSIDGALIGGESLDPKLFANLIKNVI